MLVPSLTKNVLERWLRDLVREGDEETVRRSMDTANRLWTIFKAALNHAFADDANQIQSDKPWRTVEPFKKVGKPREDHFTEAQVVRLDRHR